MRFTKHVENRIPVSLIQQANRHNNGSSVHASSMFNGDVNGEVRGWFVDELVNPFEWAYVHPYIDDLPGAEDPRSFTEIRRRGLLVWDIQHNHNSSHSTGYLTIRDRDGGMIRLSRRVDFIITEQEPEIEFLLNSKCPMSKLTAPLFCSRFAISFFA